MKNPLESLGMTITIGVVLTIIVAIIIQQMA